ncbi:MAG: hypothetical protein K8F53_12645 [Rhodocyclaceae bacterium]|nr:hypothetical protein [Rhodocyclaceae bacterium]
MESFLSIVGSVASVFGAWWALREAQKSKNWANKAEQIHDELVHRRRLTEVAQVYSETKRVLTVVARIGPSCSQQLAKGVNCVEIAKEVEGYVRLVHEQRNHFSDIFGNQAAALCDDLKDDIEGLAEARTFEDKKRFGKSIYYKIQSFMPVVKQLADDKREHAKTN